MIETSFLNPSNTDLSFASPAESFHGSESQNPIFEIEYGSILVAHITRAISSSSHTQSTHRLYSVSRYTQARCSGPQSCRMDVLCEKARNQSKSCTR